MTIFLIETESRFKMKYAVEAETFEEAFSAIRDGIDDFSQEHLGEVLRDAQIVSDEELIYQILASSPCYSDWTNEKILEVFKHVN